MKVVPLRDEEGLKSVEIFRAVIQQAPSGINVAQLRARCRVLDALDNATASTLLLEDADHLTLKHAIESYKFGAATRALLHVIDDVIEARSQELKTPQ